MRAKKGLRKVVVDSVTYYWKVTEETDFYTKRLIVLDERGSCVLTRHYYIEGTIPIITPAVVRNAIFEEKELDQKRAILNQVPYKEAPNYWMRIQEIYRPELIAGIGFGLEEDILVCIYQIKIDEYRRTITDLQTGNVIFQDLVSTVPKNKENNTYLPFGPVRQEISCLEWSPDVRIAENQRGERICCYSFYSQFIYFQPVGADCLETKFQKECVRLNKINVYNKYGFSASGNFIVVAERNNLIIWKRL